jgi:DNA-directed RNA polymerase subunit RPC12/RpoP
MDGKARRSALRLTRDDGRTPFALPAGGQALSRGDDLTCPNCERRFARRSHRKGLWEFLCSFLLIYPYRCQLCAHRFLATPKLSARTPHREFERVPVRFPVSFQSAYLTKPSSGREPSSPCRFADAA